jgi:hypothetical protein
MLVYVQKHAAHLAQVTLVRALLVSASVASVFCVGGAQAQTPTQSPRLAFLGAGGGMAGSTNFALTGAVGGPVATRLAASAGAAVDAGFIAAAFGCDTASASRDCDSDGIPNAIEGTVARNNRLKDNDVFADSQLFVMQLFRDALRREADTSGLAYWKGLLDARTSDRGALVETFLFSPESEASTRQAARLYLATFGRTADASGLGYWAERLQNGLTAAQAADAFATSPEFVARYGNLANPEFIDRVYQNVLGRPGDAAGIAFWVARMSGAQALTRGQILLEFANSVEFRQASNATVDVTVLYVNLLRRSPDAEGQRFWVASIETRAQALRGLIAAFLASAEYRSRFLP